MLTHSMKTELYILVSHKVDFWAKTITKNKGCHLIMIKLSTDSEDIIILNINALESRASKHVKTN